MSSRHNNSAALKLSGLIATAFGMCFITASADAAMLGGYAFDGAAGTSTPATVAEINGNTALDLGLGSVASYNADTPFSYVGNTSLDVSGGTNARANNDTTTVYQFLNNAAWSIQAWVKTTAGGSSQAIVSHRKGATGNGYSLFLTSGGVPFFLVQAQSAPDGRVATGGAAVNDGEWHHIVAVNDPNFDADGAIVLYVDGTVVGSDIKVQPNVIDYGNSKFAVGVQRDLDSGNLNPFDGLIDEVALFDTALQQADVTTLFTTSITVPEPGSIGLILLGVGAIFCRR